MTVIAVVNNKGGVGKTALAENLAQLATRDWERVIAVDLDAQANLTELPHWLGAKNIHPNMTGHWLVGGASITDVLTPVNVNGKQIQLMTANSELEATLLQVVTMPMNNAVMKRRLGDVGNSSAIIIDCAPSLNILTYNAICAADYVFIPAIPEYSSINGARETIATIRTLQEYGGTNAEILGIVPMRVDLRTEQHRAGLELLGGLGVPVMEPVLERKSKNNAAGQIMDMIRPTYEALLEVA